MNEREGDVNVDVGGILGCLKRHGVDFIVVGGLAGLAHGSAYPTYDVDVAYGRDRRNLERLASALVDLEATLRGAPADLPFLLDAETLHRGLNFTFTTRLGPLDILGHPGGAKSYARMEAGASETRLEGVNVKLVSLDHLIAMKAAGGRGKDKIMVAEYIALADEIRERRSDD